MEISHKKDVQLSGLQDKSYYKIYSPEALALRSRDDIYLDLKFKIDALTQIEPWISLLLLLKQFNLRIENQDWCSNKLKDEIIQLHILNRHFTKTIRIKKNQIIAYIFLLR